MFTIKCLCALIYDLFILMAIFFGFSFLCVMLNNGEAIEAKTEWFQAALLGLVYMYYFLSYRYACQTIGQKAWFIELQSTQQYITGKDILLRISLMPVAFLWGVVTFKGLSSQLSRWSRTQLVDMKSLKP